jgi:hypothetical protein
MNSQSDAPALNSRRRLWLIITIVLLALIAIVVNLRFLSGEDDWNCKDGQWIQHGHPSAPKPASACR